MAHSTAARDSGSINEGRTLEAMDDIELARALAAGDASALASLYESYADRLYSYALSMVGDTHTAADVLQDTLLLALSRAGQLRDQSKLRPWLYAITRNECLRVLRNAKRSTDIEAAGDMMAIDAELDGDLNSQDARALIDSAFAGMNTGDREVLDLALRQNLDPSAVGSVLGVSANHASARMSRAKDQLDRAVGALFLFRARSRGCPTLRAELTGETSFTPLVRKRIARHAQECADCQSARRRAIAAIALTGLPILAAPALLREQLLHTVPTSAEVAADAPPGQGLEGSSPSASVPTNHAVVQAAALDSARPAFTAGGWPRSADASRRRAVRYATAGGAAVIILLLAIAGFVWRGQGPTADVSVNPVGALTFSPTPDHVVASESELPRPEPTGSARPSDGDGSPSASPSPSATTPEPTDSASPVGSNPPKYPPRYPIPPVSTFAPPTSAPPIG